ncbi:hypothetical protein TEA_021498 [Camellia sinensis var. sinensis]|uniref:peptide-methionine (S)-S-oxide reductase n=1 Tax=Camellia sinensis var. sinensis TaxID=542762 RepID=A0A4S4DJB3_CAMSN|nr:hypothetical protein TEA_021498 [Camellia sinensis var. sinensis]
MLRLLPTTTAATTSSLPLLLMSSSSSSLSSFSLSKKFLSNPLSFPRTTRPISPYSPPKMNLLGKLGFGTRSPTEPSSDPSLSSIAQGPDDDVPAPGQQFAQFGAGCFWGVELAFQRVTGVTKTEVGYSQGCLHNPSYNDVCSGTTNHSEVVRVQYDPKECSYESLLDVFWAKHDPTALNRQNGYRPFRFYIHTSFSQSAIAELSGSKGMFGGVLRKPNCSGNDVGTQYRSGIYFYTPEQEKAALESKERHQNVLNRKIVSEILPAKKFYRAEEYHQQYLAKGGRFGLKQSTDKGCNDPIRCYG